MQPNDTRWKIACTARKLVRIISAMSKSESPANLGKARGKASAAAAGIDFAANATTVARALIGKLLLVGGVGGMIVETEAYDQEDPASHAFPGQTARNAVLFGPPGRAYVYLSYGIHWCLNIVCRESGHGAGVLIRALEPTTGIPRMMERRCTADLRLLCSGPGRLGQALAVTRSLNGRSIDAEPFLLQSPTALPQKPSIVRGKRIGITKAPDLAWRFGLRNSRFLSRPFT